MQINIGGNNSSISEFVLFLAWKQHKNKTTPCTQCLQRTNFKSSYRPKTKMQWQFSYANHVWKLLTVHDVSSFAVVHKRAPKTYPPLPPLKHIECASIRIKTMISHFFVKFLCRWAPLLWRFFIFFCRCWFSALSHKNVRLVNRAKLYFVFYELDFLAVANRKCSSTELWLDGWCCPFSVFSVYPFGELAMGARIERFLFAYFGGINNDYRRSRCSASKMRVVGTSIDVIKFHNNNKRQSHRNLSEIQSRCRSARIQLHGHDTCLAPGKYKHYSHQDQIIIQWPSSRIKLPPSQIAYT